MRDEGDIDVFAVLTSKLAQAIHQENALGIVWVPVSH